MFVPGRVGMGLRLIFAGIASTSSATTAATDPRRNKLPLARALTCAAHLATLVACEHRMETMSLTLGLTGMDPATETALKAAFTDANAQLGGRWQLLPETEAEHVMVDMDSMYGPMSWLRLHAAGKRVIGLTTAPRTQTDFRLGRPFDARVVVALLRSIASRPGRRRCRRGACAGYASSASRRRGTDARRHARQRNPRPSCRQSKHPSPAAVEAAGTSPDAPRQPSPELAPTRRQAASPRHRHAILSSPTGSRPARLTGRVRYRAGDGPALLIDPATRSYHGPATLKPLAACFDGVVAARGFRGRRRRRPGPAKARRPAPRNRCCACNGWAACSPARARCCRATIPRAASSSTSGRRPNANIPKHFRIATAMMKGPATLAEIAEGSGVPVEDVADFVNANLVTGFAEFVPEARRNRRSRQSRPACSGACAAADAPAPIRALRTAAPDAFLARHLAGRRQWHP